MSQVVNQLKVLVYDLTSENSQFAKKNNIQKQLRRIRISCTRLINSIGVQCTESVIIVYPQFFDSINDVISKVYEKYNTFCRNYDISIPQPHITLLTIPQNQADGLLQITKNHLIKNIDSNINNLCAIFDCLQIKNYDIDIKKIVKHIRKIKNEWLRIKSYIITLNINLDDEINYLISICNDILNFLLKEVRGE